jgi:hypothetical protein
VSNADAFYTAPGGAAFDPQPRSWEAVDWLTFYAQAGAPTSSTGYPGAYWFDITNEELYGPATFDPGIPGWDWGTALANVLVSSVSPTSQSGDWYVWDENGDGSVYVLFQKKTTINYNDLLRAQADGDFEVVSNYIDADRVWYDTNAIYNNPDLAEVKPVKTELHNINTNHVYAYLGGREYIASYNVAGTHEINPYDGNAFVLTITDDVTFSFTSGLNALDAYNLGTRFAELTVVLIQDATGGHTVGWAENILWHSNENNISTAADHVGIWKFISWDDGATWYGHRWGTTFS